MTTFQIVALCLLAASLAWQYMPALKLPSRKPSTLRQIESVIAIRDEATTPEVTSACNALLQALLR